MICYQSKSMKVITLLITSILNCDPACKECGFNVRDMIKERLSIKYADVLFSEQEAIKKLKEAIDEIM